MENDDGSVERGELDLSPVEKRKNIVVPTTTAGLMQNFK